MFSRPKKIPASFIGPKKIPFGQNVRPKKILRTPPVIKICEWGPCVTGLPIFLGEGVAADLGHQACHGPLRDATYHRVVTWYIGLRAQSWDQGSEEKAQGSEEWNQGSQGF